MYAYTSPLRSAAVKIVVVLLIVLVVSAAVAYAFLRPTQSYTQVVIDNSHSDSTNPSALVACARRAVDKALDSGGAVDLAIVSGSPAAMGWILIRGQSFWTRLELGRASTELKQRRAEAMAAVRRLIDLRPLPPNSSDELAALAAARARAGAVAPNINPAHRVTVMCGDGDFSSRDDGNAYHSNLSPRGVGQILTRLRRQSLLPSWDNARLLMGIDIVDHGNLPAAREAAIRGFWRAWAAASHAELTQGVG